MPLRHGDLVEHVPVRSLIRAERRQSAHPPHQERSETGDAEEEQGASHLRSFKASRRSWRSRSPCCWCTFARASKIISGKATAPTTICDSATRSEERRVGKECRSRWCAAH